MRVLDLTSLPGREVGAFGSRDLRMSPLQRSGQAMVAHVAAGGGIGEHQAPVAQLLAVVAGRARVTGAGAEAAEIGPGQAVLWSAGEVHSTEALTDVTALLVEGEELATTLA